MLFTEMLYYPGTLFDGHFCDDVIVQEESIDIAH